MADFSEMSWFVFCLLELIGLYLIYYLNKIWVFVWRDII